MLNPRSQFVGMFFSAIICSLISHISGNIGAKESDSILHDFPGNEAPRHMPPMPKKRLPIPDPQSMSEEELQKWDQNAFSKRDRNSSGFIEEEEIFQTMVEAARSQETMKLSRSNTPPGEVKQKITELLEREEPNMRKTARDLLDKDDMNKDGKVSLDEFSAARKLHFEEMKASKKEL